MPHVGQDESTNTRAMNMIWSITMCVWSCIRVTGCVFIMSLVTLMPQWGCGFLAEKTVDPEQQALEPFFFCFENFTKLVSFMVSPYAVGYSLLYGSHSMRLSQRERLCRCRDTMEENSGTPISGSRPKILLGARKLVYSSGNFDYRDVYHSKYYRVIWLGGIHIIDGI